MGVFAAIVSCVGSLTPPSSQLVFWANTYDPDTFEMLGVRTGVGGLVEARAYEIEVPDHDGIYRTFEGGDPAWQGARVVRNLMVQSADPETQDIAVESGAEYRLSFHGSGVISISDAATAVVPGNGVDRVCSDVLVSASSTAALQVIESLVASDAGWEDKYGRGCSLNSDGTVLAVGSYVWDGPAGSSQGIVYIYDWNGSSWTERGTIIPSDAGASDYFGTSCSLNGDGTVLAAGAIFWDGPAGSDQGTVYIYDWNGTDWTERGRVTASDAGATDYFGVSCSLNGDGTVLAAGANAWDGPAGSDQGTVYIYDWNGTDWTERGTIIPSDAGVSDGFGVSCSLNGDGTVLAAGANLWDGEADQGTVYNQGTVYIYDWNGSSWTERGKVTASDAEAQDYFGMSCALNDDGIVLVAGAHLWDGSAGLNQGAVYVYDWSGSAWIERGIFTSSDPETNYYFGISSSLNGDGTVLAVGAYGWNGPSGVQQQGTVYNYDWNDPDWVSRISVTNAQLEPVSGQTNQSPGEYVETAGSAAFSVFGSTNGNTVVGGVVVEAAGTLLDPVPRLVHAPQATNYFLNSQAPVTQTIAGLSGTHTVWLAGAGSVAVTGGLNDTVTDGSPLTGDPGGADVILTVTGTPDFVQVEDNASPTFPIDTLGVAVTRDACALSYDTANHDDTAGTYLIEIEHGADGQMLLSEFLRVLGADMRLNDGVNVADVASAAGPHKVGITYGGGSMQLTVDGVKSGVQSYDGTLLVGALDLFRGSPEVGYAGEIKRYDASDESLVDAWMAE